MTTTDSRAAQAGLSRRIAQALSYPTQAVSSALQLLDEGNTVPFITRYRKEATGGLDEVQIRAIQSQAERLRALESRREAIFDRIAAQGKLTDALTAKLLDADTLTALEDLYLPYKERRRTRAEKARERGLGPLAELIVAQELEDDELLERAEAFVSDEKGVSDADDALEGAADIVAEAIAEDAETRQALRELYRDAEVVSSRARLAKGGDRTYENYEDFRATRAGIQHHQVLAINRGERAGQLSVTVAVDKDDIFGVLHARHTKPGRRRTEWLDMGIKGAWRRLLLPSLEREVRNELTAKAEERAIAEFALNLKPLLLQPPVAGMRLLAIDPGLRTGCKLAALDEHGRFLEEATIYPHEPRRDKVGSARVIVRMLKAHDLRAVAIGNGTASRETEEVLAEILRVGGLDLPYTIVDEAGASVYSASDVAREEYPALDATVRGTISIGRRLQDPLAELVKIDARSIGVGLYQHDVDEKALMQSVDHVVEDCVNYVGVDLNTASVPLLRRVSGLSTTLAKSVVAHRETRGRFTSRDELLEVRGLGPRTYEQAAGFLRIRGGDEPLDGTAVHPESYAIARQLLERTGNRLDKGLQGLALPGAQQLQRLSRELAVGLPTLTDIVAELKKPGRDPREGLPPVVFRRDVLRMEDLETDQWLEGTVRNVVPFGAFVDLGLKTDGLVHVSQMADRFVSDPHQVVRVGDRVRVRVLEVDTDRQRIALSMKKEETSKRGGGGRGGSKGSSGSSREARSSGRHQATPKPAARGASSRSATASRKPTGSSKKASGGYQPFANLGGMLGGSASQKKNKRR